MKLSTADGVMQCAKFGSRVLNIVQHGDRQTSRFCTTQCNSNKTILSHLVTAGASVSAFNVDTVHLINVFLSLFHEKKTTTEFCQMSNHFNNFSQLLSETSAGPVLLNVPLRPNYLSSSV